MAMRSDAPPKLIGVTNALSIPGRILFALSILALGFENILCARIDGYHLGAGWGVIPCLPWLPAIPLIAGVLGVTWASCGAGLLVGRGLIAARILGASLAICAILAVLPKYLLDPGNFTQRTAVFESLALAAIALLQKGRVPSPQWLERASRILLGIALAVFGLNCFISFDDVAKRVPGWLPHPELWLQSCGALLILGGLSVMAGVLQRSVPAILGCLIGLWTMSVQLPVALEALIIPNAPLDPVAWSNCFFAVGLWGGLWTLVRRPQSEKRIIERPVYASRVTGGLPRRPS